MPSSSVMGATLQSTKVRSDSSRTPLLLRMSSRLLIRMWWHFPHAALPCPIAGRIERVYSRQKLAQSHLTVMSAVARST